MGVVATRVAEKYMPITVKGTIFIVIPKVWLRGSGVWATRTQHHLPFFQPSNSIFSGENICGNNETTWTILPC